MTKPARALPSNAAIDGGRGCGLRAPAFSIQHGGPLIAEVNCSEGPIFPAHLSDPNGNLIGINKPLGIEEWSDELRREAGQSE